MFFLNLSCKRHTADPCPVMEGHNDLDTLRQTHMAPLKMAIEFLDLPITNADFPVRFLYTRGYLQGILAL